MAVLFSIPVYLWNLNRPERVPKNAVSTPSSILKDSEAEKMRQKNKDAEQIERGKVSISKSNIE